MKNKQELWEKERENFHQTCVNKFRSMSDFNIWVFRNWQLASGNFYPRSVKFGKSFEKILPDKSGFEV